MRCDETGDRWLTEALQAPVDAPDVSDSVMAAIVRFPTPTGRARMGWRWAPVPLAAAGALVAALLVLNHQPAPVKSYQPPRRVVAGAPNLPRDARAPGRSPHGFERSVGSIHVPERPRAHGRIAAVPKWHTAPRRPPHHQQPAAAREKPPEAVTVASSKIVVVVTQRIEPIVARIEVEATNRSTGTVVHYDATYDEAGNEQSTYMAFTKESPDKESIQL